MARGLLPYTQGKTPSGRQNGVGPYEQGLL